MTLMRKRSASNPGRLIASHARSPLRRYTGCVSHAWLSGVRFLGVPIPFDDTSYMSKFVDHASSRPATRALNTRLDPSGLKMYSPSPPLGLEGMSASRALLRFTGVPARPSRFIGATNRFDRVPSLQVSQCRTNRLSKTRPLPLLLALASSLSRVHFKSGQSRNTSMESATRPPLRE